MFYVWWEGFLSTEMCEHFKCRVRRIGWVFSLDSVSLFVSRIVVPGKGRPNSDSTGRR